MRVAKLPGGVEISFPDGTSDKEMDRRVREFLNSQSAERHDLAAHLIDLKKVMQDFAQASLEIISNLSANNSALKMSIQRQTKAIADSMEEGMSRVERSIEASSLNIIEVLEAPRELTTDSNGRPIGTKRKAR